MVDFNLINSLNDFDAEAEAAVSAALGQGATDVAVLVPNDDVQDFTPGAILKGRVTSHAR